MSTSPWNQLRGIYENPLGQRDRLLSDGVRITAREGADISRALLVAAGFTPMTVPPGPVRPMPHGDEFLERESFSWDHRSVFDQLIAGDWDGADRLSTTASRAMDYEIEFGRSPRISSRSTSTCISHHGLRQGRCGMLKCIA